MEMVGRIAAAMILKLPCCRPVRRLHQSDARFPWRSPALSQIAGGTRCCDILPSGAPPLGARDDMIKGQILWRSAILALKLVAQEQVESRKGWMCRGLHILFQGNNGGQAQPCRGASNFPLIMGNDIHTLQKHSFDGRLPRPKRERVIGKRRVIGVEDQRRTIIWVTE